MSNYLTTGRLIEAKPAHLLDESLARNSEDARRATLVSRRQPQHVVDVVRLDLRERRWAERIAHRFRVTQKVLAKRGYGFNLWKASQLTALGQAFETLAFGSWVSFYMAIQNRIDPSNIPWVDFFKKELGRG